MADGFTVPQINFQTLAQLPQIYQSAQQQATLSDLGRALQGGQLTPEQAAGVAIGAGAPQVGVSLYQLEAAKQQHAAQQAFEQQHLAESIRHNRAVEAYSGIKQEVEPLTGRSTFFQVGPEGARVIPVPGQAVQQPTGAATPQANVAAAGQGERNEAYLKTLPADAQGTVRKIADYEINPATLSVRGGHREAVLNAVSQYDPTFDQTQYPVRQQAMKDFATGKLGTTVRSFNVVTDHLDTAKELVTALNNRDSSLYNRIKNQFQTQFGATAPTNFDAAKEIIGDEVVKAVVGSGSGALGDRSAIKESFNAARSPDQLFSVIATYQKLMAGQLGAIEQQYEQTTKKKDFRSRLSPATQQWLEQIKPSQASQAVQSQAPIRINTKADRDALPSGTQYIAPDGSLRTKP